MNQLFQNIPEHNIRIQKEGCKYILVAGIYQDLAQFQLTAEIINATYVLCNRSIIDGSDPVQHFMEKDCLVRSTEGISQILSGLTDVSVFMKEVSEHEGFNYRLAYFTRTTDSGVFVEHFCRVDLTTDVIIEDPWKGTPEWNGGSKTASIGTIESYRYIRGRLL